MVEHRISRAFRDFAPRSPPGPSSGPTGGLTAPPGPQLSHVIAYCAYGTVLTANVRGMAVVKETSEIFCYFLWGRSIFLDIFWWDA